MTHYSFLLKVEDRCKDNNSVIDVIAPIKNTVGSLAVNAPKHKYMATDILSDNARGSLDISQDYINSVQNVFQLYDEVTSNTVQQRLAGTLSEACMYLFNALNRLDAHGNRGIDILMHTKTMTEREYTFVNRVLTAGPTALDLAPAMIIANLDLALSVNKILATEIEAEAVS